MAKALLFQNLWPGQKIQTGNIIKCNNLDNVNKKTPENFQFHGYDFFSL